MNIENVILQEGGSFDRYLGTQLTLPWSNFDDIKIQPNDVGIHSVINLSLQKLYENYLYLYKSSRVASNIIPTKQIAIGGVSGNGNMFRWYTTYATQLSTNQFQPLSTIGNVGLDDVNVLAITENKNNNYFSLFMSQGTDFIIFNSDRTFLYDPVAGVDTLTPVLCTKETFENSGVFWKKIKDFAVDRDSFSFFVLDSDSHKVIKYNIEGFLTDDNILQNKIKYVDTVGGFGDFTENTFFNFPQSIDVYNSHLFVLDSSNGCVKKFDTELNWVTTYRLIRDFLSAYPVHISHDFSGNMYVLTDKNLIYKYDSNFQNKVTIPLDAIDSAYETYKKIVFSPSNNNIMYVISDKNVYKKLISRPDEDIGKYLTYLYRVRTEEAYTGFASLLSQDESADYNFTFSKSTNGGKLNVWEDSINLFDVLGTNNFDIYTLEEIIINKEEYLQNWVFNKAIAKILTNHMRLRDQITGKFVAKRDIKDNVTFRGTRYFQPAELATLEFEHNATFYVGMNEIFQNIIVNRCLKKIFDIQQSLKTALQVEFLRGFDDTQIVYLE
jgi:hypothetical protein